MGWLGSLMARRRDDIATALYAAIVVEARAPHWYVEGAVPDTVDGRFDMIAAVLAMVLLRLETDPQAAAFSARLTERFVDDMDGQMREIGIGDLLVGKHVGKMMAMLGGRLGAYRDGLADDALAAALERNLYRGGAVNPGAVAHAAGALTRLRRGLDAVPFEGIAQGRLA